MISTANSRTSAGMCCVVSLLIFASVVEGLVVIGPAPAALVPVRDLRRLRLLAHRDEAIELALVPERARACASIAVLRHDPEPFRRRAPRRPVDLAVK